jgi:hypothetical protein
MLLTRTWQTTRDIRDQYTANDWTAVSTEAVRHSLERLHADGYADHRISHFGRGGRHHEWRWRAEVDDAAIRDLLSALIRGEGRRRFRHRRRTHACAAD